MEKAESQRIRLIETWDVLKFTQEFMGSYSSVGLIETWDVLKWKHVMGRL